MRYPHLAQLEAFLVEVETSLLSPARRVKVAFPPEAIRPWNGPALVKANEALLKKATNAAHLYAIFIGDGSTQSPVLRYIGKTTKKLARQRITNHLFKKHEKTGAKLAQIVAHTCRGGTVELAWVEVFPESLRNYLEEELIHRHPEAHWNREHGQAAGRQDPRGLTHAAEGGPPALGPA